MARTRGSGKGTKGHQKAAHPVVLVFGEDDNDRTALGELVRALRPDAPPLKKRMTPLVLVKGREEARARKNALDIAKVVRADQKTADVRLVIAHQDCDALEPAHVALSERIERLLEEQGIHAVAATPAWEMEAWWYQWPEAVAAVHARWRPLHRPGQRIGLIENAKEQLRIDLRSAETDKRSRDYEESDAPAIARKVVELGIIDRLHCKSDSFLRFRQRIRDAAL